MIIARKIFFPNFGEHVPPLPPLPLLSLMLMLIIVVLSPKTARILNKKRSKRTCAAVGTFACVRGRQVTAANEKFSFQPLLERVDGRC